MNKYLLTLAGVCLLGLTAQAAKPWAIWSDFNGLASNKPLQPVISFTQNGNSAAKWQFSLGGASVQSASDTDTTTKVLKTGTGNAASLDNLYKPNGTSELDLGYNGNPFTLVMKVKNFPETKPTNSYLWTLYNSIGVKVSEISGTAVSLKPLSSGTTEWSGANNTPISIPSLAGEGSTILMFDTSSDLKVTYLTEDGSPTESTWSGFKYSSITSSSKIRFGNAQGCSNNGLDYVIEKIAMFHGTVTAEELTAFANGGFTTIPLTEDTTCSRVMAGATFTLADSVTLNLEGATFGTTKPTFALATDATTAYVRVSAGDEVHVVDANTQLPDGVTLQVVLTAEQMLESYTFQVTDFDGTVLYVDEEGETISHSGTENNYAPPKIELELTDANKKDGEGAVWGWETVTADKSITEKSIVVLKYNGSGTAELQLPAAGVELEALETVGSGALKLTSGAFTSSATVLYAATDVSAITASLGEVAVEEETILTIADENVITHLSKNSGTICVNNTTGTKESNGSLPYPGKQAWKNLKTTGNVNDGSQSLWVRTGDSVEIAGNQGVFDLNVEGGTVEFTNTGNIWYGTPQTTFMQTGGTVNITNKTETLSTSFGNTLGFLVSWNNTIESFEIQGGDFNIKKSYLNLWDGNTTVTVGGGDTPAHLFAKGFCSNNSNNTLRVKPNGTFCLGVYGTASQSGKNPTIELAGGTLTTFANDGESEVNATVATPVSVTANSTLKAATGTTLTVSGGLSGSGDLTIGTSDEPGTVALQNVTADYTGTISGGTLTISGGTVNLAGGSLTAPTTVKSGATLIVKAGDEGRVTVEEGGTLQVVLSDVELAYGYTPAEKPTGTFTYGTLNDNGEFAAITSEQGSVADDGAFVPPEDKLFVHLTFDDGNDLFKNTGFLNVTQEGGTTGYTHKDSYATSLGTRVAVEKAENVASAKFTLPGVKWQNSTISFWGTRAEASSSSTNCDTFSLGVKLTEGGDEKMIVWRRPSGNWVLEVDETWTGSGATKIFELTSNTYSFHDKLCLYTLVTEKDKIKLYVDGQCVKEYTVSGLSEDSALTRFALGNFDGTQDSAKYRFADVRVYGRALTAEEVQQLYTGTSEPQLIWMPFGDSITEGESSTVNYRREMWKILTAAGYNIQSVGLRNVAINKTRTNQGWSYHNGWRGATVMPIRNDQNNRTSLFLNLDTALEAGGYPDIITVMIGTNDAAGSNSRGGPGIEQNENRFNEWVFFMNRLATLRPHSQIFVTTPIQRKDSETNNDLVRDYADKIRNAYEEKAEPFSHANIHFVDLWNMKSSADDTEAGPDLEESDYSDNLHPNGNGCPKIGAVWAEAIQAVIGTKGELLKAKDEKGALLPVEVFNTDAQTIQVRFNKPLAETQAATATLDGVSDVTLTQEMFDARTITFTASSALTTGAEVTVTVKNVKALDGSSIDETDGVSLAFTPYGSGALANIPEEYRKTFKHRKTLNITEDNPNYSSSIPYAEDEGDTSTISAPGRVAYYMELQRPGKPVQFVWVSMDAFDTDESKLYVPTTATGNHQGVVTGLEVFANRGNISNTTEKVTGIVEFTPYTYSETENGFTTIPDMFSGVFGWRDTLNTSDLRGGCMQVARIINDASSSSSPLWANAQMLFAFNAFQGPTDRQPVDIGIGSFATSWTSGAVTVSAITYDWTYATASGIEDVMPSAYEVKKLEIWVEPAVAKVGDKAYLTLEEALAAARAGGTLTFCQSMELDKLDLSVCPADLRLAFAEGVTVTVGTLNMGIVRAPYGWANEEDEIPNTTAKTSLIVTNKVILKESDNEGSPIYEVWAWGAAATPTVEMTMLNGNQFTTANNDIIAADGTLTFDTTLDGKGAWYEWLFDDTALTSPSGGFLKIASSGRETGTVQTSNPATYDIKINGTDRNAVIIGSNRFYSSDELKFLTLTEFSASFFARASSVPGSILVSFGAITGGTIALAAGEVKDEMLLVSIPKDKSASPTVLAKMKVPHADETYHLYTFVRRPNRVEVFLDDTLWTTYTGTITIGNGRIQLGYVSGGTPSDKQMTIPGTTLELCASPDSVATGVTFAAFDMLRLYDCFLTEAEVTRLAAEYTYSSSFGEFSRAVSGEEVLWVEETATWDKTGDNSGKHNEPTEGSCVTLTATQDATITMNPAVTGDATVRTLESLTLEGSGTFTFQVGENTKPVEVEGLTTINTDVTVDIDALKLHGPVKIAKDKTLTIELSAAIMQEMAVDVLSLGEPSTRNLTGLLLGEGTVNGIIQGAEQLPAEWMLETVKDDTTGYFVVRLSHNPWFVEVDGETVTWKSGPTEAEAKELDRTTAGASTVPLNLAGCDVTISGKGSLTLPGGHAPNVTIKEERAVTVSVTTETTNTYPLGDNMTLVTVPPTAIDALNIPAGSTVALPAGCATSITGDGTLELTSGSLTYQAALANLTIRVDDGATLVTTIDTPATLKIELEGGGTYHCKGHIVLRAPVTVLGSATIDKPARFGGSISGNNTQLAGGITLEGCLELAQDLDGNNKYRITGAIIGRGSLIANDKNNPDEAENNGSSIQLEGKNTDFTGAITIGPGVVLAAKSFSLGSGQITLDPTASLKILNNVELESSRFDNPVGYTLKTPTLSGSGEDTIRTYTLRRKGFMLMVK